MRLKDDVRDYLASLRAGTAGSESRLSLSRRTALQMQFERKGWLRDGKLTHLGLHMLECNPPRQQEEPAAAAVVEPAVEEVKAAPASGRSSRKPGRSKKNQFTEADSAKLADSPSIEERQPDGTDDGNETDVHGPPGEGVVDST